MVRNIIIYLAKVSIVARVCVMFISIISFYKVLLKNTNSSLKSCRTYLP